MQIGMRFSANDDFGRMWSFDFVPGGEDRIQTQ